MLWVENEVPMWPTSYLFFPSVNQVLAALVAFKVPSVFLKKFLFCIKSS